MRWGIVVAAGTAVAAGAGAVVLIVGRRVSSLAVQSGPAAEPTVRSTARSAARSADQPLRVQAIGAADVTLTRTAASERRGRYALEWPGGHAVVGEVLRSGPKGVTRRLELSAGSPPAVGAQVELTPRVLRGDPGSACGLDYMDVLVEGELGPLPAWYVPALRGTWVILVHDPEADRRQALPALPVLHRLGLPALVVSCRGDQGAPPSPDGLGHFGETEWHDVEAAIQFAKEAGAGRIILYGWSLGAATVLRAAARSEHRAELAGLVLDSPVLDPAAAVRGRAARAGVPAGAARLGALAAEGRTGVDVAGFARLADGADLPGPTLLLHSPQDGIAPWHDAARLAHRRSDLVSLHAVPGAEHAALWNADPAGYEESLRRFLTPIL